MQQTQRVVAAKVSLMPSNRLLTLRPQGRCLALASIAISAYLSDMGVQLSLPRMGLVSGGHSDAHNAGLPDAERRGLAEALLIGAAKVVVGSRRKGRSS